MSECSAGRERSEQCGASEQVSSASKWTNERPSTSGLMFIVDHSEEAEEG